MLFRLLLASATAFVALNVTMTAQTRLVIPEPTQAVMSDGAFMLSTTTPVVADKELESEVKMLRSLVMPATGFSLPLQSNGDKSIRLNLDSSLLPELGQEGYVLNVTANGVEIKAPTKTGIFYGIQTLVQLLPTEISSKDRVTGIEWKVPFTAIKDQPRFAWRAYMLDEGRHFFGEDLVKQLLDDMARLKMNVFHWHLVDDQGWRIEIKKYPKLTEIGSKRSDTQTGGWGSGSRSGKPHSGYYTQEQIKEIVKYAEDRHITIVPEIEMPGHASAAIAAYPWLGTVKTPIEVPVIFGKLEPAYDPSDPKVYNALSEILDEVAALFPSKVIHIGGDEVRFDQWKASESVKKLMQERNLKTVADVQIYFTNTMSHIIEKKGRSMMGWNEIMGDDIHGFLSDGQTASSATLAKDTIIHFWRGSADLAKKAIKKGHRIVNSWHSYTYLDYSGISLQKAYEFDPIFSGLTPDEEKQILGLGCQMWTEWISAPERIQYMTYPRIAAYAEVGWTPKSAKDFKDFKDRVWMQLKRWDYSGINYARDQMSVYSATDFFNFAKLGEWNPATTPKTWDNLDISADSQIKSNGTFEVAFVYKKGTHAIDIDEVSLLEDGKVVANDKHAGFSGSQLKAVVYRLKLLDYKAGAKYVVRAKIKGSAGTDSIGEIKVGSVE